MCVCGVLGASSCSWEDGFFPVRVYPDFYAKNIYIYKYVYTEFTAPYQLCPPPPSVVCVPKAVRKCWQEKSASSSGLLLMVVLLLLLFLFLPFHRPDLLMMHIEYIAISSLLHRCAITLPTRLIGTLDNHIWINTLEYTWSINCFPTPPRQLHPNPTLPFPLASSNPTRGRQLRLAEKWLIASFRWMCAILF